MKQSVTLALLQFRLVLRSKGTLLVMFGLPLLLTLIFGVLVGGGSGGADEQTYPIAAVNQDQSAAADRLMETLRNEKALEIEVVTEPEMLKLFSDKKVMAGLVIPEGYGEALASGNDPVVRLITAPGGGNLEVAVRPVISRVVARAARERQGSAIPVHSEVLHRSGADTEGISSVGSSAMGFSIMFIMMVVLQLSGVILQERQHGTWGRLLTTPSTRTAILGGYLLSFLITGMFQFLVLVAGSRYLFGVSWGPMLPLAAMGFGFVLCSSGLGLLLAGLVRTAEQQRTIGTLVVVATSMLGGVFWPLEFVGETMQRIGYLTPQAWAMDGFREVMLRGGAWDALSTPLAVLVGMALVFMAGGLARVRYE